MAPQPRVGACGSVLRVAVNPSAPTSAIREAIASGQFFPSSRVPWSTVVERLKKYPAAPATMEVRDPSGIYLSRYLRHGSGSYRCWLRLCNCHVGDMFGQMRTASIPPYLLSASSR